MKADLERFEQDMLYFDQHRQELLERYPDRWVAVYHRQVVGAAKDLGALIRQLKRKGVPPEKAFRGYLTEREEVLILAAAIP